MAVIVVSRFQEDFTIYEVTTNTPTGGVTVNERFVDFSANSKPFGGTFLKTICMAHDNHVFTALDTYPYALETIEEDSTECGYNPVDPGAPFTATADVTEETVYEAKDGTATINDAGGVEPYVYTIDGSNYGISNVFTGLAPGNYTATIKDSSDLQTTVNFDITPASPILGCTDPSATNYDPAADLDNGTCTYPAFDSIDSRGNLYEEVDQFRLINKDGEIYLIDMPVGWDEVAFVLQRDKQYHGVNYDFSDGAVQLRFDLPAGKELLDAEYNKNGNDGFMRFQFGVITSSGEFLIDVDGFIDFDTKVKDRDYFVASVKAKHFNDAIENKNEIDVTLKDGYFTLPLHGKTIRKQTVIHRGFETTSTELGKNQVSENPNAPAPGSADFLAYWTFLDFSQPAPTDPAFSSYVNDLCPVAPAFGVTQLDPVPNKLYIFKPDGGGLFNIHVDFMGYLNVALQGSGFLGLSPAKIGSFSYTWYICVNDRQTMYELPGRKTGHVDGYRSIIGIHQTSYDIALNLVQGDEVYLFGQFVFEKRGGVKSAKITTTLSFSNIVITGDTIANKTDTQAKLAFEVGQDILNNITGNQATLVSNILGRTDIGYEENGCAALIAYTNGYLIRGFQLADTPTSAGRPVMINLKDYIEGLDANFAIGMGYEVDSQNKFVYRLEQWEYFYKDVLIMTFEDVEGYEEPIDTSIIYNELDFGYQKYTQDLQDVSTLDEFLTRHKYLTAIESYKATLTRLCKQIAGGYPIEITRRKQKALDENGTTPYDEENFIISCVESEEYGYIPERLENFTASGIIGPETVYNLKLTITRMLSRWAKWINSGLAYKTNASVLVNTYVAKNGTLVSQYTGDSPCENTHQFTENNNLYKGDLAAGEQKFFPDNIHFKTKLSWDKIREIKRCFVNRDPDGRNNGYFGVIDGNGEIQYGYLLSMTYNPLNEFVEFILRKKYVDLNEPFDCNIYSDYTFGDFEAATGLPREIEQCLFENFA